MRFEASWHSFGHFGNKWNIASDGMCSMQLQTEHNMEHRAAAERGGTCRRCSLALVSVCGILLSQAEVRESWGVQEPPADYTQGPRRLSFV